MFFEEIRYLVIKTWHKCVCMRADVHTQVKVCLLLLLFFFFYIFIIGVLPIVVCVCYVPFILLFCMC